MNKPTAIGMILVTVAAITIAGVTDIVRMKKADRALEPAVVASVDGTESIIMLEHVTWRRRGSFGLVEIDGHKYVTMSKPRAVAMEHAASCDCKED